MKLTLPREALVALLDPLSKIASGGRLQILQAVRLIATEGGLAGEATNINMEAIRRMPATVVTPGVAAVDCARLLGCVKQMSGETVDLTLSGTHLLVEGGATKFAIPTTNPENYAGLPVREESTWHECSSAIIGVMERVIYAAKRAQEHLGLCLTVANGMFTAFATDEKRAAFVQMPDFPLIGKTMLPPAMLPLLLVGAEGDIGDGPVRVTTGPLFVLDAPHATVKVRCLDVKVPDIGTYLSRLIEPQVWITADTAILTEIVKRSLLVFRSGEPKNWLTLDAYLGGTLRARCATSAGEMRDEMTCQVEATASIDSVEGQPDVRAGVYAEQLLETLQALKGMAQVRIGLSNAVSEPIQIRPVGIEHEAHIIAQCGEGAK